jgi:uncharacterized glyoxalase superfamily protein PhnB
MPRITPYLYCEDFAQALDFLERAFGLRERMRTTGPGGDILHAEVELEDGVVMLGRPGPAYRSPRRLGQATQSLYVYVDGVDAHFHRAREAGARLLEEPEQQFCGDLRYGAEDPEGHPWHFAQRVRDGAPADARPS